MSSQHDDIKIVWAKILLLIPDEVKKYCSQLVPDGDTRMEIIVIDDLAEMHTACGSGDCKAFRPHIIAFLKKYSKEPYVVVEVWKEG